MDIKDFILVGGGLLIAAVVAHGFWIAWRARRDPLRLDLVAPPPTEEGDELHRLRAELPNGGARVVGPGGELSEQTSLTLDPGPPRDARDVPMLLDPSDAEPLGAAARPGQAAAGAGDGKREPRLSDADAPAQAGEIVPERAKVADVIMPDRPIKADEPKEPRRRSARKGADTAAGNPPVSGMSSTAGGERSVTRQATRALNRLADRATARDDAGGARAGERSAGRSARGGRPNASDPQPDRPEKTVEELIVVHVLSPKGKPFVGGGLVELLRGRSLRYGDMNIFHRVDPMTRAIQYSVANVIEPGTFDLADLENFRSPGVCFFMQLPGPEHPAAAFEDMLKVARDLALHLGGEIKDEQRSVMTGQTVEHYRQRITDYCRRRMSMRA